MFDGGRHQAPCKSARGLTALSSRILPSTMVMTRSAAAANWRSWVTTSDGAVPLMGEVAHDRPHILARMGVEIAGRLVGEDQDRIVGERARDRHALACPPESCRGSLSSCPASPKSRSSRRRPFADGAAGKLAEAPHRQHHVLERGEFRQEEVELEDEADLGEADIGEAVVAEPRGLDAVDVEPPPVGASRRPRR